VIVNAPPVRNSRFFYLSGTDRRLHVLRAQNKVQLFDVSARNDTRITSVLADEDTVVFGTDGGNLVAMMADAPRKLWEFNAAEAIAGPVVRDGRSYYFASKDTNVYRVDEVDRSTVSLAWRCQAPAILDRPPRVTDSTVYQYAPGHGLTAIDKQSGQALWTLPKGMDLLADGDGRAYVITKTDTLAVMDNRAGKSLYWMNIAGVVEHAVNSGDTMIYLADNHGRVTCLQPTP
jgi:outer membrane protein assembly factor BamB